MSVHLCRIAHMLTLYKIKIILDTAGGLSTLPCPYILSLKYRDTDHTEPLQTFICLHTSACQCQSVHRKLFFCSRRHFHNENQCVADERYTIEDNIFL